MGAAKKLIDKKVLRDLVPINALSATHLDEISRKAVIEEVRSGTYVFKKGDRDYQTVYLLDGQVEIVDGDRNVVDTVTAGSEAACHPLAHKQPRQLGARAAGKVTVARVDSSLLDVLLTWDESAGYDVVEIDAEDNDDWMTRMLQSQAFLQLPPSNIHQLLMRLEAVTAHAGDVIVHQDDEGDYFYIVKSGRLAVTRKASPRSTEVLLAELGEGACFGEEALVSGTKRNASVTMLTDGYLMRLSKSDFNDLLCAPLVHEADFEGAQKLVAKGAKWLDVRLPGEYENQAIKGSINLPLSALREQCSELDRDADYIVCCDTGRRSAAGAFVLRQRGFSVYTLKNGLMDAPDEALTSPRGKSPAASAKDADIIPFDSENRSESAAVANSMDDYRRDGPVDGILIDKLASAENDKLALLQQIKDLQMRLGAAEQLVRETEAREQGHQSSLELLQEELTRVGAQLRERDQEIERQNAATEHHKTALQDELAAVRKELASSCHRLDASNDEKGALQAELIRLQQTLSQIQQSADGRDDALRRELEVMAKRLDSEQKRYEKQRRELESELGRVREDYQQLGQRTSAVAGERDAAVREKTQLQDQVAALQDQFDRAQVESRESLHSVEQALHERAQELEAKRTESAGLQQKLEALQGGYKQLQEQVSAASENVNAERSHATDLQGRLEELKHQHQSLESTLQSANQQIESLQEQLRSSEQQAGERLEQQRAESVAETEQLKQHIVQLQQQLEQTSGEVATERDALAQRLEQLELDLQARQLDEDRLKQDRDAAREENRALVQRLADQQRAMDERQQEVLRRQSENQGLERQLEEVRRQLEERTQQEQGLREEFATRLDDAEERNAQLQQQAEQSVVGVEAIEAELTELRKQHKTAEQRSAELEQRLASVAEDHQSDLASVRKALSRAQTETENVQREQSRLLDSLRKAERALERERQDHETEVYRLRRELKEAAGESSAGLAAELEAVQTKLKEGVRARDDLEIKLGERSAQLEDVQAVVDKLTAQLHQAQDSARQAEQQLLETNQTANLEMAVRIEAEEKAQQVLRDELAAVIAERNRSQELLTVQLQELNELRAAMQSAQQENTAERHHSEEVLLQLQQERDDALQRQLEIQQQLDQLRAEAEVTRGLVDMQTPAEGDAGLRDQLEQAKKNVDVAVRLRTQVEQKNGELKAEIAALRAQLEGAALPLAGHIPSLDEGDPHAGAVLNPAYPDALGDEPRATTVLIDEEQSRRGMLSTAPASYSEASAAASAGGGLRTLIGGVVMVALAAGAGVWWVLKQPSPRPDYQQASTGPGMQDAKPQPAAENKAVPQDTVQQPAWVPSLAKGSTPNSTKVQAGVPSTDANVGADLPTADGVSVAPPRLPKRQPIRSFSEPLSSGGRAPTVVEFQADSFDMGSGISSPNFDERPRHRVDLQRFAISKHEVTFDEYDRFARDTGRSLPRDNGWGRGERPVINVRWQDALAYTQWLSEQTGSRYRLPTEAEWEFAARAGSDARFWWGNDVGDSHANCFDCGGDWAGVKTAPVGSFATSPFAVNDMAGNVMEWVQDCFQPDYTGAPDDGSAVASGDCRRRVVRGGAYDSPSESLRSASRDAREADTRLDNLGFRVVKQ